VDEDAESTMTKGFRCTESAADTARASFMAHEHDLLLPQAADFSSTGVWQYLAASGAAMNVGGRSGGGSCVQLFSVRFDSSDISCCFVTFPVIPTCRPRVRLEAQMSGGGQERGLRSGTVPTAAVVGLGAACEVAAAEMEADSRHIMR
jgi:hypothetical protein